MTDYGHSIIFGLSLDPSVGLVHENRRLAQAADTPSPAGVGAAEG